MMRISRLVIVLTSLVVLAGCSQYDKGGPNAAGGKTDKTVTIDVTQPSTPKDKASVTFDGTRGRVGAARGTDQVVSQMQPLTWAGIALCIAGVAVFVVRQWLPLIPVSAGVLSLALGVGFIALPIFLDRYLGWIVLGAGIVLVAVAGLYAYRCNWFDHQTGAEMQQKLLAKGDIRGAGALAWLRKNAPLVSKSAATAASKIVVQAKKHKPSKKVATKHRLRG